MRALVFLALCSIVANPAFAAGPNAEVPPAATAEDPLQLAQNEDFYDPDLENEETLEELHQEEYDKGKWSVGSAVGLSFIPGGGWGLLYADKGAASSVPFVLSLAGYTLGALYMGGVFDESSVIKCQDDDNTIVRDELCDYSATNLPDSSDTSITAEERRAIARGEYTQFQSGEDFDGGDTGLIIIGTTYALTTLLGATWAGLSVSEHNERLRRDIESTAWVPRLRLGVAKGRSSVGLAFDF